jgi:thiosulfate/3-mercaptopyruvate sulfurtransferase
MERPRSFPPPIPRKNDLSSRKILSLLCGEIFYLGSRTVFSIMSKTYAHPDVLVETSWLAEHLNDPGIRVIESNEDVLLYDTGHIPGAVHIDWRRDLQDPVVRDYISPEAFAELCSRNGISPETTCIFYGDKSNWWACYALWTFRLFGHQKVKILNGGRDKWIREGRPLTREKPTYPRTHYPVPPRRYDEEIRAFYEEVLDFCRNGGPLIDVRSPQEYRGELLHMPEYPQEGALRGGHIPGAKNVPWKTAVREDGTFKSAEELQKIYEEEVGLSPQRETIVYCRIGERSSHTWFVLNYLLGFSKVKNYDGSWTEWGNKVRAPIER